MGEKVKQYLNGNFEYEGGSLFFSCSRIELNLEAGEIYKGSFFMEEQSGKNIRGSIFSSLQRMECITREFDGNEIEVLYEFDTRGMGPGDVVKGVFNIICDKGEYVLPFVVNMVHKTLDASIGSIKNLFHFTNLAKSNWDEACKIFQSDDFGKMLGGNDDKYKTLYQGLVKGKNPNKNLEEFLIGVNKKQKIEYIPDRPVIRLENPEKESSQIIRIDRNGWGYCELNVTVEGDFLSVDKLQLTDNDFLGNCCHYNFFVSDKGLHEGNNYGKLTFTHMHGSFCVEILVHKQLAEKKAVGARRYKSTVYALTRHYLDFRMMKLAQSKWLVMTQELLSHRRNLDDDGVENALFQVQMLITQERYNEAKWILDHSVPEPTKLSDELYCYYLYLTTLYNVDELYSKDVARNVQSIYNRNPQNWRIAWLLLHLSGELNKSVTTKWNFCVEQIKRGCNSPIFYIEVLQLLNGNPSLLIRLGEAEKRLIYFGAKHKLLAKELSLQFVYLAQRTKEFDKRVLKILEMMYEKHAQDDILEAICMVLMRGNCTDNRYFVWFDKGVNRNLQITRLYEYYMMSLDMEMDTEIPKRVLMYFSYECALDAEHAAYLYAYVEKNRHKLTELYELYLAQMERFLIKQLYGGKINDHLAFLYQEVVMRRLMTPDNARTLAPLLLQNKIKIKDKDICKVIVLDERLKDSMSYDVENGYAMVSLFSNEHVILLEDRAGNRYYGTREYTTKCYFLARKLMPTVSMYAQDSLPFNLYMCSGNKDFIIVTPQNVRRYEYIERHEAVETEFRKVLRMKLITYYFEQDDVGGFEEMLVGLEPEGIPKKDRAELVRYMAIRGYYEHAYRFASEYGPENMEPKTIVRICTTLLSQDDVAGTDMVYMLYSAFERGKYNELSLQYLMRYYDGPIKNLRDIWKAAIDFDLDTYSICEKIILQMLETGAFIGEEKEIFKDYVLHGSNTEVEMAYIAWNSYEYMVHERVTDDFVFTDMERLHLRREKLPIVSMMAYLKRYAEQAKKLPVQTQLICKDFLGELITGERITLPFMAEYKEISTEAAWLHNMTMIEYKGNPDSTVVIHYIVSKGEDSQNGYTREEMRNMYGGIFVKNFLLFFGESLQYYITEEYQNKEQLTESGSVQKNDALSQTVSDRFSIINDIAVADTLQDYSTAQNLLEEYEKQKYITAGLFSIQ